MKAKRVVDHTGGDYGIRFDCPGCGESHVVPTKPTARGWDFNGSLERPTISPSLLVTYRGVDDDGSRVETRCHSFVRDGRIEFLSDCTHALAGQTVDLPEIETP